MYRFAQTEREKDLAVAYAIIEDSWPTDAERVVAISTKLELRIEELTGK